MQVLLPNSADSPIDREGFLVSMLEDTLGPSMSLLTESRIAPSARATIGFPVTLVCYGCGESRSILQAQTAVDSIERTLDSFEPLKE